MRGDRVERRNAHGEPGAAASDGEGGTGGLVALLVFFLLPGAACAVYLWHVLNRILTVQPVGGGELAMGLLVLVIFGGLLTGMAYCLRRLGSDGGARRHGGAG